MPSTQHEIAKNLAALAVRREKAARAAAKNFEKQSVGAVVPDTSQTSGTGAVSAPAPPAAAPPPPPPAAPPAGGLSLSNPFVLNSLVGASAGGLLGLATSRRKKLNNALYYALLGGLGGAGVAAGQNLLNSSGATPKAGEPGGPPAPPKADPLGVALRRTGQTAAVVGAPLGTVWTLGKARELRPAVSEALKKNAPALHRFGKTTRRGVKTLPWRSGVGGLGRWLLPIAASIAAGWRTGVFGGAEK
jgi:hypothetical protein